MLFNIFLISIILVVFFMLAMGLKYIKPKADQRDLSCSLDETENEDETCGSCQIKEIANCSKKNK